MTATATPLRIVVAPNALKGSLSAPAAARAMADGVRAARPAAEVIEVPVADGGDGLLDVLSAALGGELLTHPVTDPLGRPREARWLHVGDTRTAVIETAACCGLALLAPGEHDPLVASTSGVGQLVAAALDHAPERLLLGLGGSATSDGGAGMATALGIRLLDGDDQPLPPGGGALGRLARIDATGRDARLAGVEVVGLCDVDNPLLGPRGAAAVYGPQKGADEAAVAALAAGLGRLAEVVARDLRVEVAEVPGAGAGGGLGAGVLAFLGGGLSPGVETVLSCCELESKLRGAVLVLTAEGALDAQTLAGKGPAGVAALARRAGVPCIALSGAAPADVEALSALGLAAAVGINPPDGDVDEALRLAAPRLRRRTEEIVSAFLAGA